MCRIFRQVYERYGIEFSFVDARDNEKIAEAKRPETKCLYLETPSNPLLRLTDISAAVALANDGGKLVVVDNTFATPYLQNPLALGADVVLHSMTKYLGGHSDVIAGCLIGNDPALCERYADLPSIIDSLAKG